MPEKMLNLLLLTAIMLSLSAVFASTDKDDDWLEAFDDSTDHVNEGMLVFTTDTPDEPVHHMDNQIAITNASLTTGWVSMQQCHHNIDNVSAAQIVFNRHRIRKLAVLEYQDIDKVWVEGHSVQLEQVGKSARVCINAETRALSRDESGDYLLKNGPFMRRFLDGFYTMRVSLSVSKPDSLKLVSVTPSPQPGFSLHEENGRVHVNTLFEGKLNTELRFAVP